MLSCIQEKVLLEENSKLRMQCGMQPRSQVMMDKEVEINVMEVETQLFIGPPERRGA